MESRVTLSGCGKSSRKKPCEGLASIHQPARTKSSALRTVQDGCPSHSSSTQVAYIVRGGSRFKQEKKRLILCKQASSPRCALASLRRSSSDAGCSNRFFRMMKTGPAVRFRHSAAAPAGMPFENSKQLFL
jgi:hypothetical protein